MRRAGQKSVLPFGEVHRVNRNLIGAVPNHDNVQGKVHAHQHHGDPNGFFEALEKNRAEKGNQHQRHRHLIAVHKRPRERIF